MILDLEFKRFQKEYYPEYASWFMDPELNHQLGPMDHDWLDAVLTEPATAGVTWAIFMDGELVAVVETVFDPQNRLSAAIAAIATKPSQRRQDIGSAVLQQILSLHESRGITEHVAYVAKDNLAGQRCFQKAGFVLVDSKPDEHGFIEFRHRQSAAV